MCRWKVEEEDVEDLDGAITNHHRPLINKPSWRLLVMQLLHSTIAQTSVVVTAIAHASTNVGQGGPSNLQRFKAHHPPTFKGGGEPMEADHWFWQVGKI